MTRTLHPRHGPHRPSRHTPPRRPGSVRRTTTHDVLRSDGLLGDIRLVARGRDLVTGSRGEAAVAARATIDSTIAFLDGRRILGLTVDPLAPALDGLVGTVASSGFRAAVDAALPGERQQGSLRYQLLDDLPTAVLVSGHALGAGGAPAEVRLRSRPGGFRQSADICAGWVTGGTIMAAVDRGGLPPPLLGPAAPALDRADDPLAWHPTGRLDPHGTRRQRRIDVWAADGAVHVDAFFRDTHVDAAGFEEVVHEYHVAAALDPRTLQFTACEADVGVLPWVECPAAAASAAGLVGVAVGDVRHEVRRSFAGPSTCTHLNDTLRSLDSVSALLALLA